MSHILFITYYYPPEKGAAMVRISETAKRLVKLGHQVTVLTTVPNYPTGIVPPEYRGRIMQEEMRDGVRVVRVWNYINSNTTLLRRILPHIAFNLLAPLLGGRAVGHPDVIITCSLPLFNAIAGRLLSWWKRCPYIFWVADLWPETPIQLGILHNRLMIRLSRWLEWSAYEHASIVWVVAEGVRNDLIQRGFPPEHIFLCINGVDTALFRPIPQTPVQARTMLDWDDRFTVLYAGTHGVVHGLTTILDAAFQIRDRTDIQFVFIGDGAQKTVLIDQAYKRNLKNITFLDAQQYEQMPLIYAAADICLVPARRAQVLKGFLPAKLFEIMACGRPILLGVDGEARQLAEQEAGAALFVEPENPTALVSAILYLKEQPYIAESLGKRGRAFAESNFDRDQLVTAVEARIGSLVGKQTVISITETPFSTSEVLASAGSKVEKNQ
jgi:putative colanic acid biosynthesis glycosyltransferase WcaI